MKVVRDLKNFTNSKKTVLTIGTFDGVHIGHQKIIKQLVETAQSKNLTSVVLTFFPHPRMVLQNDIAVRMIDTVDEKIQWLDQLGVDVLVIHPFSKSFSRTTAVTFARDIIANQLNAKEVIIGYDHRFGQNREATIEDLETYGQLYNFKVAVIPAQDIESIAVSSTKIRKAMSNSDLSTVRQYLNRPFRLTGLVVKGDQIGKSIGFPTANVAIEEKYKLWPSNGVYLVQSRIDQQNVWGMMNIGNRPTVAGKKTTIEVHFFDFNKNLYEQTIALDIHVKIREENKFDSLESLKKQLQIDQQLCLKTITAFPKRTTTFTKN